MVENCASSHKIDYVAMVLEILNFIGHQGGMVGLKGLVILLNMAMFPIVAVATVRVCMGPAKKLLYGALL